MRPVFDVLSGLRCRICKEEGGIFVISILINGCWGRFRYVVWELELGKFLVSVYDAVFLDKLTFFWLFLLKKLRCLFIETASGFHLNVCLA